ncbi:hypothetical protein [Tolypothrix sp. NIES-4075]|uniref:hypothetical protein n=1 Tax=Tolypothrix sp. NIES-4075 TaxID=2005459 RepID=UPI001356DBA8|nr:hypothetical protein [Tolypothrix sp. NIES-4075]
MGIADSSIPNGRSVCAREPIESVACLGCAARVRSPQATYGRNTGILKFSGQ